MVQHSPLLHAATPSIGTSKQKIAGTSERLTWILHFLNLSWQPPKKKVKLFQPKPRIVTCSSNQGGNRLIYYIIYYIIQIYIHIYIHKHPKGKVGYHGPSPSIQSPNLVSPRPSSCYLGEAIFTPLAHWDPQTWDDSHGIDGPFIA